MESFQEHQLSEWEERDLFLSDAHCNLTWSAENTLPCLQMSAWGIGLWGNPFFDSTPSPSSLFFHF